MELLQELVNLFEQQQQLLVFGSFISNLKCWHVRNYVCWILWETHTNRIPVSILTLDDVAVMQHIQIQKTGKNHYVNQRVSDPRMIKSLNISKHLMSAFSTWRFLIHFSEYQKYLDYIRFNKQLVWQGKNPQCPQMKGQWNINKPLSINSDSFIIVDRTFLRHFHQQRKISLHCRKCCFSQMYRCVSTFEDLLPSVLHKCISP